MPSDVPPPSPELQLQLSRRFVAEELSGPEFRWAFLLALGPNAGLPKILGEVLIQIFHGVNDYVADDGRRARDRRAIDEEQLREVVRTQLARLDEAGAADQADEGAWSLSASDFARLSEPATRQLQLTRRFAAGLIPGPAFETAFLGVRMEVSEWLPPPLDDVMNEIFYAVDDYVADDELRPRVFGGIDEEQLREIVRTQLARLDGG